MRLRSDLVSLLLLAIPLAALGGQQDSTKENTSASSSDSRKHPGPVNTKKPGGAAERGPVDAKHPGGNAKEVGREGGTAGEARPASNHAAHPKPGGAVNTKKAPAGPTSAKPQPPTAGKSRGQQDSSKEGTSASDRDSRKHTTLDTKHPGGPPSEPVKPN